MNISKVLDAPVTGQPRIGRRSVVAGAAWSVPTVLLVAPAAQAAVSQCTVTGSIQTGPQVSNTMRAICTAQSQWLNPGTLLAIYGVANLPAYLEICNCQNAASWYRWRETDTLSEFQIEVDGVHIDQGSSAAGYRNSFFLPGFGTTGGCKRFALTYRTSVARPTTNTDVSVTFELEKATSSSGPWTNVTTLTVSGTVHRNNSTAAANVDFNTCSAGGSQTRLLRGASSHD